jgi:hypothetical protein
MVVLVAFVFAAVSSTVLVPVASAVQFSRQRFKPPGGSYLSELLADGILNPKIYS